jgi:hypothetical protein
MPDRVVLFLFSLLLVVGGLMADAWLVVTNQVGNFDGLFPFCSSSVMAFAFGLYLRWFIRSAVSEANVQRSRATAAVRPWRATNGEASAVLSNVH